MRWKLVVAAMWFACTPNPPPAADAAEQPFSLEDPNNMGLVGCSRCDSYNLPESQEQKLREIDGTLQACEELGAAEPVMWQAHYTVPGLDGEWRRFVVSGGPGVRACMEKLLRAVAWPQGWSAKVQVLVPESPVPEDPQLAETYWLSQRINKCSGSGNVELDVTIDDESGSTALTSYTRGPVEAEACFREALRGYTLPSGWKASYSLKRDGVDLPIAP